jgi:hypothetical protein
MRIFKENRRQKQLPNRTVQKGISTDSIRLQNIYVEINECVGKQ